jgi:hypothetical protein
MTRARFGVIALSGTLLAATVGFESAALASDSIGIYAVVKKVKYEPDPQNATALRVRLCGAFAKARVVNGDYFPAEAGYMYYSCPTGQEAMCRMQWAEIETASKGGTCIGWGVRRDPKNPSQPNDNGSVRTALPVANADAYEIGMGTGSNPDLSGGTAACNSAETATVGLKTEACDEANMPPVDPPKDPPVTETPVTTEPTPQGACSLSSRGTSGLTFSMGMVGLFALGLVRGRRRAAQRG